MFSKKIEIACPCGKVRETRTIHNENAKHRGDMVCAKCKKRFVYEIIGGSVHSWYK